MAENKQPNPGGQNDGGDKYQMKQGLGVIAMLISATGMGCVPLFSRWATRTDMFNGALGLNGSDSIGALMACGRMGMGVLLFLVLMVACHKVDTFKKLKLTPAIALAGLMIGMSLACYVTSTLMTTVANAVLFIYIGPVVCVVLARIFRKEPMSALQWICLAVVFVGMLFGEGLLGFGVGGQAFGLDFNLVPSTPEFPQKIVGDAFGLASGFFYGASMFFNGYRKDADTIARGVWNFVFAVIGAASIVILMNIWGGISGQANWMTEVHFNTFNWIGAVLLWIICGPLALGFLLVAGRNLPAADYGTIAYWEVPVALFIGLVVFGEALTVNTIIGGIMIIAGGAVPSVKGMVAGRKQDQTEEIAEALPERIHELVESDEYTKITEDLTHIQTQRVYEPAQTADQLVAKFEAAGITGVPAELDIVERTEEHVRIEKLDDLLAFAKGSNLSVVTYDVTYFPHADDAEVNTQVRRLAKDLDMSPAVIKDVCASEIADYIAQDKQRDATLPVHSIVECYTGGTAFAWYGMNPYPRLKYVLLAELTQGGKKAEAAFVERASKAQVDYMADY